MMVGLYYLVIWVCLKILYPKNDTFSSFSLLNTIFKGCPISGHTHILTPSVSPLRRLIVIVIVILHPMNIPLIIRYKFHYLLLIING